MVDQVVVATTNKGKLREFSSMLEKLNISVYSLEDYPKVPDVIEDGLTFEENARKKAETICRHLNKPTIADDSGLEVDALNGQPGIYSARFAGKEKDDKNNNNKLIELIKNIDMEKRTARFVSAIALAIPHKETIIVRGTIEGLILDKPRGTNGFGYDPLFYIPSYGKTMAELEPESKNKISHRANALNKLVTLLESI